MDFLNIPNLQGFIKRKSTEMCANVIATYLEDYAFHSIFNDCTGPMLISIRKWGEEKKKKHLGKEKRKKN